MIHYQHELYYINGYVVFQIFTDLCKQTASHSYIKNNLFCSSDEDSNGEIDKQELKHCFQKLEISFTEEEINDLFEACDINEDMGMKFNEFIVFLCLIYLLNEPAVSEAVSFS
jgi:hypothetical protein